MQPAYYDYKFKLIIGGSNHTGKSSLIQQFSRSHFDKHQPNTIGVDFESSSISIDNFRVKLEIWDLSGGERFHSIITTYYRGAHGVILVYDITNRNSFLSLRKEIELIGDKPMLIVGTKADLEEKREVSYEEAKEFGKEVGFQVIEASAKDNVNIEDIFSTISRLIEIKLDLKRQHLQPLRDQMEIVKGEEVEEPPPKHPEYDERCKLIMIGDSGVGKSNMLRRLCKGTFNTDHIPTNEVDFDTKIMMYKGQRLQLQICDPAGRSELYDEADMILFVYDISNRDSFENLNSWVKQVTEHNDGGLKIVIGNKNDLEKERKVSYEEGKMYAGNIGGHFFEISAINGDTFENNFLGAFTDIFESLGIGVQS